MKSENSLSSGLSDGFSSVIRLLYKWSVRSIACGAESQWMVPLTFLPSAGLPFPVSRSAVQRSSARVPSACFTTSLHFTR